MTDRKTARPGEAVEAARVAQRTLNDALATAKQLKAKSREARRRLKAAKKTAKKAAKDARAARKVAQKARRQHEKAVARVAKARKKAAKREQTISTPKRRSPSRNHPHVRRADRASGRARQQDWEVGEGAADNGARSESAAS
jgi:hypothetical protein